MPYPVRAFLAGLAVVVAVLALARHAGAEEGEAGAPLVVGTKEAPPFSMKDPDGTWRGITIDLVGRLADELEVEVRFEEASLDALLDGVATGRYGVAAAALTVTAERETRLDFSHPYYTSGLGLAVAREEQAGLGSTIGRIISSRFLLAVLALAGILAAAGVLLWLFERKRNPEQFGGGAARGLGAAFWWSAVTMTTVGYGDKAPVTFAGRLVAILWMFASVILVAGFTGAIASALTVSELSTAIQGPEDLPGKRVGVVQDATSEGYVRRRGFRRTGFADLPAALEALRAGRVDAVIHDRPLLAWAVRDDDALDTALVVLPRVFERQDYALALPQGGERREALNRAIVRAIGEPWWDDVLNRYLGD